MKTISEILATKEYICDSEGARCYYSDQVADAMEEYAAQFRPALPSDAEIRKFANEQYPTHPHTSFNDADTLEMFQNLLIRGAKWFRDQIALPAPTNTEDNK